jgi:hypothetical protein
VERWIAETLSSPETVVRSRQDPTATLYYRRYTAEHVGDKYLCVVVKETPTDHFMLTAYFTNRIKQGERVWIAR